MECERPSQACLDCHSKQPGDQRDLASHIPFCHPLQLPFPHHIHGLLPLECSPSCQIREKAHPWFRQPFNKAMILLDQII